MISEKLKTVLTEEIRKTVRLILEERRLDEADLANNPVDHEIDRMYEKISGICEETVPKPFKNNIRIWTGMFDESMFGVETTVHYKVISYPSEEIKVILHSNPTFQKILGFNTKTSELYLSYEIIDGVSDDNVVADEFGHELNHLYQDACRIQNQSPRPVYGKDLYGAVRNGMESKNICERCVARLIYYSNRREQDSLIQGFKSELRRREVNPSEIDNTETEFSKSANEYERYVEYFLNNHESDDMKKVISFYTKNFGYDYRGLYDLFRFRYGRLFKKYKRAVDEYTRWYKNKYNFFSEREGLNERYI